MMLGSCLAGWPSICPACWQTTLLGVCLSIASLTAWNSAPCSCTACYAGFDSHMTVQASVASGQRGRLQSHQKLRVAAV